MGRKNKEGLIPLISRAAGKILRLFLFISVLLPLRFREKALALHVAVRAVLNGIALANCLATLSAAIREVVRHCRDATAEQRLAYASALAEVEYILGIYGNNMDDCNTVHIQLATGAQYYYISHLHKQ